MQPDPPPAPPAEVAGDAREPNPIPPPSGWFRVVARVIRVVFGVAAAVFIAVAVVQLARKWDASKVSLSIGFAVLSVIPIVAGTWILGWGWKKLMERMAGRKMPTGLCIALHVDSQMARYTPGKVGMPLVRMSGAERIGVSARVIGVSVFVEILSLLAVGGVVAFATLLAMGDLARETAHELSTWAVVVLCGFGLATVLLLTVDRRFIPSALRRFVDDGGRGAIVPMRLPIVHAVYWLTWVLHGYLVSRAVGANAATGLASSGLYALAPIVGFLVMFTPGGLGVRESVLAFGLTPLLGPAPAACAAIASRGISLLGDVIGWLLFRPFGRMPKNPC